MKKSLISIHILLLAMLSMVFVACKKDSENMELPPVLDKVRVTTKDSTAVAGTRGTWFVAQGKYLATAYKLTVNDREAYLNPTFIKDDNIVFTIPSDAPFANTTNKIKVFTKYGEAVIDFRVIAPPPTITSVLPLNVAAGDIVTVTGLNLTSAGPGDVKFGNTVAEIMPGATETEMKIKIPAGERFGNLNFTVNAQTASSKEVISVIRQYLYNDNLAYYPGVGTLGQGGIYAGSFNGSFADIGGGSTDYARQGTKSLKAALTNSGGLVLLGAWGDQASAPLISAVDGRFLKFSVYVKMDPVPAADKVNLDVNTGGANVNIGPIKGNEWVEFIIPLSSLGNPAKITSMQFKQAASPGTTIPNGGANIVYLDEMGIL